MGVAVLIALAAVLPVALATRFVGNLTIERDWQVVAHFAVDKGGAKLHGQVFVTKPSAFVLYDDQDDSWKLLHRSKHATCRGAATLTSAGGFARKVIPLTPGSPALIDEELPTSSEMNDWRFALVRCPYMDRSHGRVLGSRVDYFKHLHNNANRYHHYYSHHFHQLGAKQSSDHQNVGKVWIDLHATNKDVEGTWVGEFPADETKLLPWTTVFLLFSLGLLGFMFYEHRKFLRAGDTKMVSLLPFQAIAFVAAMNGFSLFLSWVELVSFAHSGVEKVDGVSFLRLLSVLTDEIARLATIMLLVLFGTGWMIISPRLQDADFLAQSAWLLGGFYAIATIGSLVVTTSPNFSDEYHGVLWLFVIVVESALLLFSMGYALNIICFSSQRFSMVNSSNSSAKQKSMRDYFGGENVSIQAKVRSRTLRAVTGLLALMLLENWCSAIMSSTGSRPDSLFVVNEFVHCVAIGVLVMYFRPWRCKVLQSTKAATREAVGDVNKVEEYGDEADDDFEGILPLIETDEEEEEGEAHEIEI